MRLIKKITRRQVLVAGGIGAAGLVLSLYLRSRWERAVEHRDCTFFPNVWLQIAPDDIVTIWVAKSEMGQGVRTSLAMLVAEELEADWRTIRVQQASSRAGYGEERTQGSTSVRTSWDTLRRAGAAAREMLVTAAAQTWRTRSEHMQGREWICRALADGPAAQLRSTFAHRVRGRYPKGCLA